MAWQERAQSLCRFRDGDRRPAWRGARALDGKGLTQDTLVIVTSDNGCSPEANFEELAEGHNPSYHFRGNKADIYDGGHHIPFIVRWPGREARHEIRATLICLTDLWPRRRTSSGELPDTAAEDSVSLLPALRKTGLALARGHRASFDHRRVLDPAG